ncbi:hypothetical protein Hokovirus_1_91 [Hokovirus HKV1]|uniref:Uncharacterized protein n=1 Tax=Hokovirus HKV1 TaxID=1977638 RepID=A0A1V0SES2_9VIRU|nr:hypothetical protein Hokovirus_1_91 [Hokovirus HKV1]
MTDFFYKYKKYKTKYIIQNEKILNIKKRKEQLKNSNTNSYIELKNIDNKKTYIIQDNGGEPFKVVANKNIIKIYDNIKNIKILEYKNIPGFWPGIDTDNPENDGSSVLIKITNNKYIHVTDTIYEFETSDIIIDYIADLGNSLVSWPIAFGNEYIYFLSKFDRYVDRNALNNVNLLNTLNLYDQFMDNKKLKSYEIKNKKIFINNTKNNFLGALKYIRDITFTKTT